MISLNMSYLIYSQLFEFSIAFFFFSNLQKRELKFSG